MKARRLIAGLAIASLLGAVANAQGIKYINYHPDNIPTIPTAPGIASEIIFEDDETIEYFTFGFDDAWTSTVALDHILVFKSKDEQPETNLLVHTNKRNYVFTLITGNSEWEKYPDRSKAIYSMRIRYQDNKSKTALAKQSEASVLRNRSITDATLNMYSNYDYRATERAADIIPVRMWDNGILTFITFRPGSKRGVVYELQADGRLAQVNQHTEKNGVLVVQGVYPGLMIRLGDEAVDCAATTSPAAARTKPRPMFPAPAARWPGRRRANLITAGAKQHDCNGRRSSRHRPSRRNRTMNLL
ncbi:TrbG/VirB9 family P-type conjugative transfer protein [uncultured Cardiobacterium sp.]|uniref:TrbG/VirB9 family P-type conjugative transfer protein n=1 Tax=uncultured Cardiobacterium sp. TaxID=417619 RepID=UPI00261F4A28|nr:TrbG/VirB9 family P-type conjugative transfer protein [uncultured Cardiobacterium sp.]